MRHLILIPAILSVGLGLGHGAVAEPVQGLPIIGGLIKASPGECAVVGVAMTAALKPQLNLDIRAADGPHGVLRGSPQAYADDLRKRLPTLTPDLALEFAQDILAPVSDFYQLGCDWAAFGQPAKVPAQVCFGDRACEPTPDPGHFELVVRRPWISRSGRDALVRMAVTFSVDQGDSYVCHLRRADGGWTIAGCQRQQY